MNTFASLNTEERRAYFDEASAKLNLPAPAIEKDFWVCWTLRQLFDLPEWGNHLTFKGGTSLSKVWRLIQRFSEDIDLTIDRDVLGFAEETDPERAATTSQRMKRIKMLKSASRARVEGDLAPRLRDRVAAELPDARQADIHFDAADSDHNTILFRYPRATPDEGLGAMLPHVKIELGPRGDNWPAGRHTIVPYLEEALPGTLADGGAVSVQVLDAERTFLEKAMLIHEESFRPVSRPRKPRMARHYYDLFCMITAGVGARAMKEPRLLERVRQHRQFYYPVSWVDYATMAPGNLRFVPPPEAWSSWETDYDAMREVFFFGPAPIFREMMDVIQAFQNETNGEPPRKKGVD